MQNTIPTNNYYVKYNTDGTVETITSHALNADGTITASYALMSLHGGNTSFTVTHPGFSRSTTPSDYRGQS